MTHPGKGIYVHSDILRKPGPEASTADRELPISFGAFLVKGILPKLAQRSASGRRFIRLGRILTLS